MKISEAISQIKADNRALSDDILLTDRYIWSKIKSYSMLFIKQSNDKFNLSNNNFMYTTIDCVEMELVDSINCCQEIPACKILRSVKPIPKIVESNVSSVIKGIFNLDTSERIDLIKISDVVRLGKFKYKPQGIKAFIKNNYLYIPFRDSPRAVSIEALFENPEDIYNINSCKKGNNCMNIQDMPWHIPSFLESTVLQEVNKDIFNFRNRLQPDENTNKNETQK